MTRRGKLGFTIVELLVIIGILASITAIAAPKVLVSRDKAEEIACQDQMDFVLQGFQNEQLYPDSSYAFTSVTPADGVAQLNAYIAKAIDPATASQVDFPDHVACPSGDTRYEAAIQDDRLYVYCPVHKLYSHTGLRGRAPKVDPTVYDTGDGWTGADNNWIVGDHESLMPLPIESEYYHMEIKVRMVAYDDGIGDDQDTPDTLEKNPIYEYRYLDPDYFWPINTDYYAVKDTVDEALNTNNGFETDRPLGYDLDVYNPTNDDLFFGMIIDYQVNEGVANFTSNALEIKNINSNAGLDMELDLVERDEFNSKESSHATHERDLMDSEGDWFIIDVLDTETVGKKRMVIHMQQDPKKTSDSDFKVIFDEEVPLADPDQKLQFAFFIGKRDINTSTKVGEYYTESYPTPVQVWIQTWNRDFDETDDASVPYTDWIDVEYKDYPGSSGSTIPNLHE